MDSRYGPIIKPAASYKQKEIMVGESVLVINVQHGVLYVVPFESIFDSMPN